MTDNQKRHRPCGLCGDRCVTLTGGWDKPPANLDTRPRETVPVLPWPWPEWPAKDATGARVL